jgi:UDP-N-acetylmuramyl tripeptide synthase
MLASEHLERAKDMLGYARACNNLAVAYLKQPPGRREISVEDVRRLLVQALRIQQHIGDEVGLAATEQNLAWLADLE